jgi:hypothetical protein
MPNPVQIPLAPKSATESLTVYGCVMTAFFTVLHMAGLHIDKDQTLGIIAEIKALWPQLLILGGVAHTFWDRITHVDFSISVFAKPHFISGLITALMVLADALGVKVDDLQHSAVDAGAFVERLPGLIMSIIMVIGAVRSGQPIRTEKAIAV